MASKLLTLVIPVIGAFFSWVALWPALFFALMIGMITLQPIAVYCLLALNLLAVALQLRGLYLIYIDDWKKKNWLLVSSPIWLCLVSIVISVLIGFLTELFK